MFVSCLDIIYIFDIISKEDQPLIGFCFNGRYLLDGAAPSGIEESGLFLKLCKQISSPPSILLLFLSPEKSVSARNFLASKYLKYLKCKFGEPLH